MNNKKLLIICGPTASGKTAISIKLAKALDGEIISADSMQIYKGMDIGTSKVTVEEMEGIKHHLLDVVSINEPYSAAEYAKDAWSVIDDITNRGKIAIIAGGTGFFIDGIIKKKSYGKTSSNDQIRAKYESILKEKGKTYLHNLLIQVDEKTASGLHENDTRRIIRALEIFDLTGIKKSEIVDEEEYLYDFDMFFLDFDRAKLYERINMRVDIMVDLGLVEEVKSVMAMAENEDCQALKAIGYKEIISYLEGEITYEQSIELLKKNTRNYAKRQITWFKNKSNSRLVDMSKDVDDNVEYIIKTYNS